MSAITFVNHPPRVFVIGITEPKLQGYRDYLHYRGIEWNTPDPLVHPESIVEAAGRVCYASFHNPANKSRERYIQESIIQHKHGSVLEHIWINLMVADLPRSSQLELVRHGEGTGFSFESTRFTDKYVRFVIPPHIRDKPNDVSRFTRECYAAWEAYTDRVDHLSEWYAELYPHDRTLARKRAKEAARSLLPNALGSDGVVSMNARAARHIIELRSDEHADLSIREFAWEAYKALKPWWPTIFADAQEVPATEGPPQIKFSVSKV